MSKESLLRDVQAEMAKIHNGDFEYTWTDSRGLLQRGKW